jgi:hypothetical protein
MQIKVKRADGASPLVWIAIGPNVVEILANWRHCFGIDFVQVDGKTGQAVATN